MSRVIVITTDWEQLPSDCLHCCNLGCRLPTQNRHPDQVKKAYWTKRHKDCPIAYVEDEHLQPVKKSRV